MSELVAIIVLSVLLVGFVVYHGVMVHKLINKIMSRNYAEYEASKPLQDQIKVQLPQEPEPNLDYLKGIDPRLKGM